MEIKTKSYNLELVKKTIEELENDFFTNHDIVKKTNLNYSQVKKYLQTMIDFEELKYSETTKMYMRL